MPNSGDVILASDFNEITDIIGSPEEGETILSNIEELADQLASTLSQASSANSNAATAATNASNANTNANAAKTNTAVNNTASSTGTLSQKLSYIIEQLNNLGSSSSSVVRSIQRGSVATTSNYSESALSYSRTISYSTLTNPSKALLLLTPHGVGGYEIGTIGTTSTTITVPSGFKESSGSGMISGWYYAYGFNWQLIEFI